MPAPGGVAVGVGNLVAALELEGGVLLEERDHARRGVEEGRRPWPRRNCCRARGADRSRGASGSSVIPARCASGFSGVHIQPPDHAVVPPNTGSFSATITSRPCQAAVTAADRPPAPDPTTRRSHSMGAGVTGLPALRRRRIPSRHRLAAGTRSGRRPAPRAPRARAMSVSRRFSCSISRSTGSLALASASSAK